jgi:hypothetical protein
VRRSIYHRDEARTDLPKRLGGWDARRVRQLKGLGPKVARQKVYERSTQAFKHQTITKALTRHRHPIHGWPTTHHSPRGYGVYLERESKTEFPDGERGQGFNQEREAIAIADTANEWASDKRFYEVILSPESGHRLDMEEHTRGVMAAIERDLETRLEWIGVIHHDTDHVHAHVMVRGIDERGNALWIQPEYLAYGISDRAREDLNMRMEMEQDQCRERSL